MISATIFNSHLEGTPVATTDDDDKWVEAWLANQDLVHKQDYLNRGRAFQATPIEELKKI